MRSAGKYTRTRSRSGTTRFRSKCIPTSVSDRSSLSHRDRGGIGNSAARPDSFLAQGIEDKPKCGDSTIIDYLSPFQKMRPAHPPPSGMLSFGPRGLRLQEDALSRVIADGRGGFGFVATVDDDGGDRDLKLAWTVRGELQLLSAKGRIRKVTDERQWSIGTLEDLDLRFFDLRLGKRPALYRYTIAFWSDHGRLLERYSQYVRVVPRWLNVAILTVSPGEMAKATLVNLGTVPLITRSYDHGFGVEAFTGEEWIPVPENPRRLIPKRKGPWTLSPGMEDRNCLRYLVPADQAPGLFRFVTFGVGAEPEIGMLAAEFQVAPGL